MEGLNLAVFEVPHIAARRVELLSRGAEDAIWKGKITLMSSLQLELDYDYIVRSGIDFHQLTMHVGVRRDQPRDWFTNLFTGPPLSRRDVEKVPVVCEKRHEPIWIEAISLSDIV